MLNAFSESKYRARREYIVSLTLNELSPMSLLGVVCPTSEFLFLSASSLQNGTHHHTVTYNPNVGTRRTDSLSLKLLLNKSAVPAAKKGCLAERS